MQTVSSSQASGMVQSLDLSVRYNGLIQSSFFKRSQHSLFSLFDYVFSESPPMYPVHNFISMWRILQFFGNALCAANERFWQDNMYTLMGILSTFFHFIPSMYRQDYARYVAIGIAILFIIAIIFLSICAAVFNKTAKLPKWAILTISIFFATFGYLLPIAVVDYVGEMISYMINGHTEYLVFDICTIVLVAFVTAFYVWLYSNIYTISIMYRPDSLQVSIPSVASYLVYVTIIVTFIHGIAADIPVIPQVVVSCIGGVIYIASVGILFTKGGLVSKEQTIILATCAISAGAGYFVSAIFCLLGRKGSEITIVAYTLLIVVVYVIFKYIYDRQMYNALVLLDDFVENGETDIYTPFKFLNVVIHGMRAAHPCVINNTIFKWAIEQWPMSTDLWVIFAKFTAIYPEETQQLSWILMSMQANHLTGSLAKYTMQQITVVMRLRETNLVPSLKRHMDKVQKQIQATKHKIRYIWDLVLQGNVSELETIISRAYDSVDATDAEILHMIRMYPNNRFCARCYARFMRDVTADHAGNKEWSQKATMLQRGERASPDQANVLGLRAFPNLPLRKDNVGLALGGGIGEMTDDTLTFEIVEEEESVDADLRIALKDSINQVKIPSYHKAITVRFACYIILFLAPVVAMNVLIPIIIEDFSTPLTFMYGLSSLRTKTFQVCAVGLHYILEKMGKLNPDGSCTGKPLESLGNQTTADGMVSYLIKEAVSDMDKLNGLMDYKMEDSHMDKVRTLLYTEAMEYQYIATNESDIISHNMSIQNGVMEYVTLFMKMLDFNETYIGSGAIFGTKYVIEPINNLNVMDDAFTECLKTLINYVNNNDIYVTNFIYIAFGLLCGVVPVMYIGFTIYITKKIKSDKVMIYRSFSTLPKNVVSKVAETLKVLRKDSDDDNTQFRAVNEELNKQEENLLKIFTTSADVQHGQAGDTLSVTIASILTVILFVGTTVMICLELIDCNDQIVDNTPHIDYLMRSYAYDLCSIIAMHMLAGIFEGIEFRGHSAERLVAAVSKWKQRSKVAYSAVRFGSKELNARPFPALTASARSNTDCLPTDIPKNNHDIYRCWTADMLISYNEVRYYNLLQNYVDDPVNGKFHFSDPIIIEAWHISIVHVYDTYFYPMFTSLVNRVVELMNKNVPLFTGLSFVFLALGLIIELVLVGTLIKSEMRQKFMLRLLLHCPSTVVVNNPNITALLNGNFSAKNSDLTTRTSQFYDTVVKDLPDAVIVLDKQGNITTTNRAAVRMFGLKDEPSEEIIGQPVASVIGKYFVPENPFEKVDDSEVADFCCQLQFELNGERFVAHASLSTTKDNRFVVVRDITQNVMYDKLISEERAKSDQLLSSILPPRLVPRVQAGEKNISFSVQSASVLFLDIVSFTPWCGSNTAQFVMSTLNHFFKELDKRLSKYPTLTKIKCIGDCYMAAGGIFSEINQPAQHTKEMVEFGLDALDVVREMDEDLSLSLQIRVGINTGGPLVAGVLGTDKPTFEILGPTINMAQQMEHHGVPMKVHVSRAVYELIYGANFDVKERGEIQVKNGTAITYIVERKP